MLGAGALLVVAAGAWWMFGSQTGDAVEVTTTTLTRVEALRSYVTASGEIVATRYADLGSSVMGRVVSLNVREGDRVRVGQVLAQIDPVQAQSAVASAAAALQALESEASGTDKSIAAAQADVAVAASAAAWAESSSAFGTNPEAARFFARSKV